MQSFINLAFAAAPSSGALDDMLRLIGIAAIVYAVFKGIKTLISKPTVAAPPVASAPPAAAPAPVVVSAPTAAVVAAAPVPATDSIPPEILAVIAAAVAVVTDKSRRVISIRKIDTAWERAGRQSVLSSHKIR